MSRPLGRWVGAVGEGLRQRAGHALYRGSPGDALLAPAGNPKRLHRGKASGRPAGCGILAHVAEIENHTVYINVLGTAEIQREMSPEEIQALAAEFLPAHLEWSFDFGVLSWDYIDGGITPLIRWIRRIFPGIRLTLTPHKRGKTKKGGVFCLRRIKLPISG